MKKLLKMFGFGTALAASGLAFADWWCNRCHRWHHGRKCPAVTLGFACDDHRNYGCAPYGCFYQDNYACEDDGYDSDDENKYVAGLMCRGEFGRAMNACQTRQRHHDHNIDLIIQSLNSIRNANDFRLVLNALDNRAWQLDLPRNQYGCIDFYGCQDYGCMDFYGCF